VFGGGLLNEGNATVTDCTFSGNQALAGGGSSFFGGSVGGAIDNFGGATLTVTGSTFTSNQALGASPGTNPVNYGIGGAIENNARVVPGTAFPSTATITNCTFSGNVAGAVAGAGFGVIGNGGALDNEGGTMTISSCTFRNNQSVGGGADGLGGAILNSANSTL